MIRLNITIDKDLHKDLSGIKNKSEFIRNAVREKLEIMKDKELRSELEEGYKTEGKNLEEWDTTVSDGWD